MKNIVPVTIDDLEATALDDKDGHTQYSKYSLEVFAFENNGLQDVTYTYLEAGRLISREQAIKILERK